MATPTPLSPTAPVENDCTYQYLTGIPIVNMKQVPALPHENGAMFEVTGIFLWRARPLGFTPSDSDFTIETLLKESGIISNPQDTVEGAPSSQRSEHYLGNKADRNVEGRAAATMDANNWQIPADARAMLLSDAISAPIYDFLQGYVVPKANGYPFPDFNLISDEDIEAGVMAAKTLKPVEGEPPEVTAYRAVHLLASQSGDWMLPLMEEQDMGAFYRLCLNATFETVADFLRYCITYFYPMPFEELAYTVETFRLSWAGVMRVIEENEARDLQLAESLL